MSQPNWKQIAQLGDVNPIDHGGYFVSIDETGVYDPEGEILEAPPECDDVWDDETGDYSDSAKWTVWRFALERCTFENGVLSDNQFHPDFPAWFAKPESERANRPQDTTYLSNVADCVGADVDQLRDDLCSEDVVARAQAYRSIGEYHGFDNFDSYPLSLNIVEVRERYKE